MKKLPAILSVAVLALLLALPPMLKNYGVYLFTTWLVFVIATMGLNLTVGYAGQKSLGHAAFFGIGAYTVAILMKAGFSFWLGLPPPWPAASSSAWAWASRRCGCGRFTSPSPRWASTRRCGW